MEIIQSLQFVAPGHVEWQERPAPRIAGAGEALVRSLAASICDIDRPVLRGTSPWHGPFAFGHEAVAEVVELSDDVTRFAVGDRVAVTWHINCGRCTNCAAGLTAHCLIVAPQAMYGLPAGGDWGGLFDDIVRVPFADAMLTRIPQGIGTLDAVSVGDNLTLGYQTIARHLAAGRRRVLVLGSDVVGINVIAFAVALGADHVVYVDDDPAHRALASDIGAHSVAGPPDRSYAPIDLVVDASFNPSWLRRSVHMLSPEGAIECVGGYFDDITVPILAMYANGVSFHIGRANTGPHIGPALQILEQRRVDPSRWSTPIAWDEIADALADPPLKPVAIRPPLIRDDHSPNDATRQRLR